MDESACPYVAVHLLDLISHGHSQGFIELPLGDDAEREAHREPRLHVANEPEQQELRVDGCALLAELLPKIFPELRISEPPDQEVHQPDGLFVGRAPKDTDDCKPMLVILVMARRRGIGRDAFARHGHGGWPASEGAGQDR